MTITKRAGTRAAIALACVGLAVGGGGAAIAADSGDQSQDEATLTQEANGTERGMRGPGGPPPGIEAVSELLGMDQDAIREARESGTSLAQLAEQNGKTAADVEEAIIASAKEHLAEQVSDGDITQDEADERLSHLQEDVSERVSSTEAPERGHGGPGGQAQSQTP